MSLFKRKPKWHILINERVLGPFTLDELAKRKDITPFTLARRRGKKEWKMMAQIPELVGLFRSTHIKATFTKKLPPKEVLTLPSPRPSIFLWTLLALFILIYFLIGIYAKRF